MNSMKNLFGGPKKITKETNASNPTLLASKSGDVNANNSNTQNGEEKVVYSKTEQDAVKKIFEVILKDAPE